MPKRGQLGNVFIYVFAIVVIGLILMLGYNYISKTRENIVKTDLLILKKELTSDIESISSDFGSSKKSSYSVPNSAELCLFDLNKRGEILNNLPVNFNLLIKDSIASNVNKNAFVVSKSIFKSYYIGNIEINEPYFKCLKPIRGKISFVVEGAGSKALILNE
jgi:hypothetical protein|tara:strand:- start:220 stop:705 length:486 start_codon:yes stop_codon:yes gene_type:complete